MRLLLFSFAIFIFCKTYAQDSTGHFTVAILPVTNNAYGGETYSGNVQDIISKVFVEKTRFTVVDRTKFDQIAKEKNLQKQEDFLDGYVVDQGKSLGAQYLISGNINQITKSSGYVKKSKLATVNGKLVSQEVNVYVTGISMNVNIQIIDVETGKVKSNKSFNQSTNTETANEQLAVTNAIAALEPYFRAWINEVFPVYMKIIRIESTTKKGLPETVLITGGADMNLQHSSFLFNTSSELEVYENEVLLINGKEYNRPITVGKLKLVEVQGELSICKVKSGGEEIQKRLNAGKTLLLKISSY